LIPQHFRVSWQGVAILPLSRRMPDDRTFLMGKFPAVLPGALRYARNHMWAAAHENHWRFGFTSYAVRLMQDVYFLDWQINPGDAVELLQQIGHIETSKAVSDLSAAGRRYRVQSRFA
jgi:glycine cleavage system H protein